MKSLCFNLIMASNIGNSLNNSATRVILRQQGKNLPIFLALNLAFHLENEIQSTMKFLLKWKRTAAKDTDICVFMEIAKISRVLWFRKCSPRVLFKLWEWSGITFTYLKGCSYVRFINWTEKPWAQIYHA